MWRCDYCTKKNMACHWPSVKCGKIMEVTPEELQTSSLDLQDVRRDFSFSLCAAPLSDSCPKISEQEDGVPEIGGSE